MPNSSRSITAAIRRLSILLLVAPATVAAQQSTTRGLSVGAHLQGTSLTVEDDEPSGGGGLGLRLGYGFNRIVTGFVQLDGSSITIENGGTIVGDWALAHAEVGARFHFANSLRRWVPYLEVAAGGRAVSVSDASVNGQRVDDVTFSGGAVTVGGGLSAYLTRKVALDVSLKFTGGTFNKVDLGNVSINNLDIDASSVRFGVGFVWWPKS
jgi:Outer membrane protein beta-barrel domain